jgi:endo-1,4-beta-xylanase
MTSNRRNFLLGAGAFASTAAIGMGLKYFDSQVGANEFVVDGNTGLGKRAAAKGLLYGGASDRALLSSNPMLAKSFAKECSILVSEDDLKWQPLRPTPNTFDFSKGDWLLQFARRHEMQFRGHVLVWHQRMPTWFKEVVNRQNAEKFLLDHIATVAGRYAGKLHSWDVVNEAVRPGDGRADGLRTNTPWLELLGPDYIELAFRGAAAADPKALLVYNDTNLEYDTPDDEARRKFVLQLLEKLKSRGTPVQALGIQGHLRGDETRFNPHKLSKFLSDVASMGLKILVTEMDVEDYKLPQDILVRDRKVANAYYDFLSVVLDEPAVEAIVTWGLSDRYTWLADYRPRSDKAPVRPLPLDEQMKRKAAWNAIASAFDQAPER